MAMVRKLLLLLLCGALVACERIPTAPEDAAGVQLQVRFPDAWRPTAAQQTYLLALRVSGSDVPAIVHRKTVDYSGTAVVTLRDTVTVPVGLARRFELFFADATDPGNLELIYYADTTVDLERGTEPVALPMYLDVPPPPPLIRIFTGWGLAGGRDSLFFKDWLSGQVSRLGYRWQYQDAAAGFNPNGADLFVIPKPNSDYPFTTKDSDVLISYLQSGGGAVLFLGDADFGADMQTVTGDLGFYFAGETYDSLHFAGDASAPLVADFGRAPFLPAGDTLLYYRGVECLPFTTGMPAVIDTIARLSEGGYVFSDFPTTNPPAVGLYGTINGGRFVAIGDLDWIGNTQDVRVGELGALITTGIGAKQHQALSAAILNRLAPLRPLVIP